jgi:RNA polymerase sigma-70 factor (ECF subfamily)
MTDLEKLYRRYAPDVYRFSFWLSGDEAEAEDLTAETFVRAWAGPNAIRAETAKAYLLAIARNLHRQRARRAGRTVELDPEMADSAPRPDEAAESRHELDRVRRRLLALPEIDRAALLLRVEHELPYDEIARVLEISTVAAKVKVHRARIKLGKDNRNGGME